LCKFSPRERNEVTLQVLLGASLKRQATAVIKVDSLLEMLTGYLLDFSFKCRDFSGGA
jgi:hypothetical protein